jgi:hypothetical protein
MNTSTLYKFGSASVIFSGIVNIFADFLPIEYTRLLNFAGVTAGILGFVAVYLYQRNESGSLGFVGYLMAMLGFVGIAGFLFVDAFVFPYLNTNQQEALVNGQTGFAIFISVIVYVAGVILFNVASLRSNVYPKIASIIWVLGVIPTLAALALPAFVLTISEIMASVGILWIGITIWQGSAKK